jgi:hypothetical protein
MKKKKIADPLSQPSHQETFPTALQDIKKIQKKIRNPSLFYHPQNKTK